MLAFMTAKKARKKFKGGGAILYSPEVGYVNFFLVVTYYQVWHILLKDLMNILKVQN